MRTPRRFFPLLPFLLAVAAPAAAQGAGAIAGRVLTRQGQPLAGATVVLSPVPGASAGFILWEATTDAEGRYTAIGIPIGSYRLMVRAPGGYSGQGLTEAVIRSHETTAVDWVLDDRVYFDHRVACYEPPLLRRDPYAARFGPREPTDFCPSSGW